MALIKCPECEKEVSDSAKCCPNCGCPIKSHIRTSNSSEHINLEKQYCFSGFNYPLVRNPSKISRGV